MQIRKVIEIKCFEIASGDFDPEKYFYMDDAVYGRVYFNRFWESDTQVNEFLEKARKIKEEKYSSDPELAVNIYWKKVFIDDATLTAEDIKSIAADMQCDEEI